MHDATRLFAALLLTASTFACAADEGSSELEDPYLLEGAEIQQILADDPGAMFLVDLSDEVTYTFDQRGEAIDFDHVFVASLLAPEPSPMPAFADANGFETSPELWTLTIGHGFRSGHDPDCLVWIDLDLGPGLYGWVCELHYDDIL